MKSHFLKMSIFVAISSAFFCVIFAQENRVVLPISPEIVKQLKDQAAICSKEIGVDAGLVKMMLDWTVPDEEPNKKFLYCLLLNTKYVDADGHFDIPGMLILDPVNGTKEEYKKGLEECNAITLGDKYATTYEMCACLHRRFITAIV